MRLIYLLGFILSISSSGFAQNAASAAKKRTAAKSNSSLLAGVGAVFWQEGIFLNKDSDKVEMLAQFSGLSFHLTQQSPLSGLRWYQSHGAVVGYGQLKGEVALGADSNLFRNQPWLNLAYVPAINYRSTATTDVGLAVPLMYRIIQWKIAANSNVAMDKKASFTTGLSLNYLQRLSKTSNLRASVSSLMQWQTSMWNLGWDYSFR